jgi:RluA family pseudouridine synthase
VLHLDEAVLVVRKPAPLPVHPCGRFNRNTLVWLLAEAGREAGLKPRPAHRLDANTAGLMVLTLTREAARDVQGQFARGEVGKLYLAEVAGLTAPGSFDCRVPLEREPTTIGGRRTAESGLSAESRFRTLAHLDGRSLLAAVPVTGRTNQLRAHLWHLGTPVIGDRYYLPEGGIGDEQTLGIGAAGMRLQASLLRFRHPFTGQTLRFSAVPEWGKRT